MKYCRVSGAGGVWMRRWFALGFLSVAGLLLMPFTSVQSASAQEREAVVSAEALPGAAGGVQVAGEGASTSIGSDDAVAIAPDDELSAAFARGLPLALAVVFLIGLALNLTPCVYPMLAVTVSIFGSGSENRPGRAFLKALVYVLGIATMYSVLGVAAALTGGLFGGILQSRGVLIGISLLFVLLALSMFGLYEIKILARWTNKLGGAQTAGWAGTFISGLLVGIFAAPCVGPPIIALLALVGQRADPVFGFVVFFVLSLGLGAPYLVLGTFSGLMKKLPRSGEWMLWVKKLLGFVLIGVAVFYLSLASRPELAYVLIPLILVVGGVYLGFFERSRAAGRWFPWMKRIVGTLCVLVGVAFFVQGRKPSADWQPYSAEGLAAAKRPGILYFSASWCIPCMELDRMTFTDPLVMRELGRFDRFKVDLTHYDSPESTAIRELFNIQGVPTMVFLASSGAELPGTRLVGFAPPSTMLKHLQAVLAHTSARSGEVAFDAGAFQSLASNDTSDPSEALLVADVEWIQPGRPFRAGVLFKMKGKWHAYWINAGDSGGPPRIDWEWPEGFRMGSVGWPHPQRFDDPPFATFGHTKELLLAGQVYPPDGLEPGTTVTVHADVDWLVCDEICIALRDRLTLELPVRDEPPAVADMWVSVFERAEERVPAAAKDWKFSVSARGEEYLLTVTPPREFALADVMSAEFFPAQPGFLTSGPYRWQQDGDVLRLLLTREGSVPQDNILLGVLVFPDDKVEEKAFPRAVAVEAAL